MKCNKIGAWSLKGALIATLIFLTSICSEISAQEQRVTFKFTDAPISEIFKKIKSLTNLSVVYNLEDMNPDKRISIDANNQPIGNVMETILRESDEGLTYVVKDNYIVLTKRTSVQQATSSSQQKITVTGTVIDENDEPLIGVNVVVEGTSTGTATDFDGNFSLQVDRNAKLTFSYIGYMSQTVNVLGTGPLRIVLKEDGELLEEVVVTALGIKRSEKALSYNVQQVSAEELTTIKDANFMNALAGKVAGVNINASSVGIGGATRVVMRGPKSINPKP